MFGRKKIKQLEEFNRNLTEENFDLIDELQKRQRRLTAAERRETEALDDLVHQEELYKRLQERFEISEENYRQLNGELHVTLNEKLQLQTKVEALESELEDLECPGNECFDDLKFDLETVRKELKEIQDSYEELETRVGQEVEEFEEEIERLHTTICELKDKLADYQHAVENAKEMLNDTKFELTGLEVDD